MEVGDTLYIQLCKLLSTETLYILLSGYTNKPQHWRVSAQREYSSQPSHVCHSWWQKPQYPVCGHQEVWQSDIAGAAGWFRVCGWWTRCLRSPWKRSSCQQLLQTCLLLTLYIHVYSVQYCMCIDILCRNRRQIS